MEACHTCRGGRKHVSAASEIKARVKRAETPAPTSDFRSSDLPESLLLTASCSSSSLLLDAVLPLHRGPPAGGAAGARRKECV